MKLCSFVPVGCRGSNLLHHPKAKWMQPSCEAAIRMVAEAGKAAKAFKGWGFSGLGVLGV